MSEKVLYVQMFGGFSMYYGGEAIALNKIGSAKSVRLLQMLLLSLHGGIPKNELIDNLYGWNENADVANRNKNLNNLIYRLGGQLVSAGLPDGEYVEISEGRCRFTSPVPLELDTARFEDTVREADDTGGGLKRVELLQWAADMYCGELLPGNQTDMWFFRKSNYYKEMYLRVVRELEDEYTGTNDYKNLLMLYARAAAVYPFEHWQIKLIRCNLELYRYDEAMEIYNETMELYAREMGAAPAREMQECFEELELIDKNHSKRAKDLADWQNMDRIFLGKKNEIQRAIFDDGERQGAYYCAYPSFVDYCRLVARGIARNKTHAMLMFLTLSGKGSKEARRLPDLPEQMRLLKDIIGGCLRVGDAYTRYGNRHFILMLMNTSMESCSVIFGRIENAYAKRFGKGELWYYADMTQELSESII